MSIRVLETRARQTIAVLTRARTPHARTHRPRRNMIFESVALNAAVIIVLIVALSLDYLTKFFSYWYVRFIPYKTPVPAFGSDYERVLGVADSVDVANQLYFKHPKDKYVGYIKSRIPELIIRDPDAVRLILSDDASNFRNRGLCLEKSCDRSVKNNVFFAENELWRSLRGRIQSFFNSEMPRDQERSLKLRLKSCLPIASQEINVRDLAHELTDVFLFEFLLNLHDNSIEERKILTQIRSSLQKNSLTSKIKNYTMSIFPSLYVLFQMSRVEKSLVQRLLEMLPRIGAKKGVFLEFLRRKQDEGPLDLSSEGKNCRKRSVNFDEDLIVSQIISLISEGLIPCHNVICAALYELSRAPEVLAEVHDEIDKQKDSSIDSKALSRVIDEVLRLYPSYSLLNRVCVSTYKIPNTNILIDKGVTVAIPVGAIHRDAAYYKDPDVFNPDRFREDEVLKRHPYTYLPFGAGPRRCIGSRLAMQWVRSCLSGVLQTHTVSPSPRSPNAFRLSPGAFSSTLQRDVWITLFPRQA